MKRKQAVRIFDSHQRTWLNSDWSNNDIDYRLQQNYWECEFASPDWCDEWWQVTLLESLFRSAKLCYTPAEDSKFFLWEWAKLINTTAQKPLVKILSDLTLNKISVTSIFYLKEQTLALCFKIIHLSGRNTPVSNTASWNTLELILESPEGERLAKISSESKIGLLVWYWH